MLDEVLAIPRDDLRHDLRHFDRRRLPHDLENPFERVTQPEPPDEHPRMPRPLSKSQAMSESICSEYVSAVLIKSFPSFFR